MFGLSERVLPRALVAQKPLSPIVLAVQNVANASARTLCAEMPVPAAVTTVKTVPPATQGEQISTAFPSALPTSPLNPARQ